jgi:hypothetical protein
VGKIHFEGMHYRRDIGAKGLRRLGRGLGPSDPGARRMPDRAKL